MPAKSGKQYRYMAMAANKPTIGGPSKAVAEKFVKKTSKKKRKLWSRNAS